MPGAFPGPAPPEGYSRGRFADGHPAPRPRDAGGGERDLRGRGRAHCPALGVQERKRGVGAALDLGEYLLPAEGDCGAGVAFAGPHSFSRASQTCRPRISPSVRCCPESGSCSSRAM